MELCQCGVVSFINVKNISEGVLISGPLFVILMSVRQVS